MPNHSPLATVAKDARVYHGRVIDVDINSFTVSVAVEFINKVLTGLAFASPYHHFSNGEGIFAMPEVGSLCWLCEPSDGARPFILGWAPAMSNSGYRSNRKSLNPGDIYLGTRDENFIILRRGGVVQIGGGPLSQRLYLPVQNTIRDICENYSLESLAGSLEWIVDRQESTTDGKRPSRLKIKVRDKTSDKGYIAALQIGAHEDDAAVSLVVNQSGEEGATTAVSLKMLKDGNIEWKAAADLTLSLDGNLDITTVGDVSISASGGIDLQATSSFKAKGSQVEISADTTAVLKASASVALDAPAIRLGGDSATFLIPKGPDLVAWLSSHTHLATSVGFPTSPPIQAAAAPSILSSSVYTK